jgi:hypothetical protein
MRLREFIPLAKGPSPWRESSDPTHSLDSSVGELEESTEEQAIVLDRSMVFILICSALVSILFLVVILSSSCSPRIHSPPDPDLCKLCPKIVVNLI